jgi:3-isopropylmalate/(R)-2-methylmalate dehydratase large subunit
MPPSAQTLFDKIWQSHVVAQRDDGSALLHVDRHVMHDLTAQHAFSMLERAGRSVHSPALTIATHDHVVSSAPGRNDESYEPGTAFIKALRVGAKRHGIQLFGLGHRQQGIVHVIAPELGATLPGSLLLCGDSHTCTNGGLGALAWGIGTSEVEHVLATQTIVARRPKTMRILLNGRLGQGVSAKDLILHIIGSIGARGGNGYAIEYAGEAVRALSVEGRLTLCNMSIECGARIGMVAPDDSTYQWLAGRPFAPAGAMWERAVKAWRALPSDPDARFDSEVSIDVRDLAPQVTWGTSPAQVLPITGRVPDPRTAPDSAARESAERALQYMGLEPDTELAGLPINTAFIGSCTNSRIEDLRVAAAIFRGRRVAPHVRTLIVPGSMQVRRQAEAEGLDRIFIEAGCEWRESACSMCAGINDDRVGSGERSLSTSNRNFEGRQGPGARTHLASPATVAASAIAGAIADPRLYVGGLA